MSWKVSFDGERVSLYARGRISETDAARQERTAREILRRLAAQPGLVLADEVGMGKTFVAMAVAACAAWAYPRRDPVVVMVPSTLIGKWSRDFDVFRKHCVRRPEDRASLRAGTAHTGVALFKLLDDPPERRPRIVFMNHRALHRALDDHWVKLAILAKALRVRSLRDQREKFPRFAARIMRLKRRGIPEALFAKLIKTRDYSRWREVMAKHGVEQDDDPIPAAVAEVLVSGTVELKELREELRKLPRRDSARIAERIKRVRRRLRDVLRGIWHQVLINARFRSPLVILDEAHHLKNPATRLASLFVEEKDEEEKRALQNALGGMFERMLFLTATPFQLGHGELINVLDRFRGVRWSRRERADFKATLEELRTALDESRQASLALDQKWGRLAPEDLRARDGSPLDADAWWEAVQAGAAEEDGRAGEVLRAYERAREAMQKAESLLRPWIIRHRRPRTLPGCDKVRRLALPGAGIILAEAGTSAGLEITEDALLPFLLAARCEAVRLPGAGLARTRARATFAEGLASSYEAYRHTREDSGGAGELLDEDPDVEDAPAPDELGWYLAQLDRALPDPAAHGAHPKVAATVQRALALWELGEKVLIFCHFRKTGGALRAHVSRALSRRRQALAEERSGRAGKALEEYLRRLGNRFEEGRPFHRLLRERVDALLARRRELPGDARADIFEIVRRFVRTEEFLVRYFPLDREPTTETLERALAARDGSGLSLEDKLGHFVGFIADRCEEKEREAYLDALRSIQTGARFQHGQEIQPNVRLVNGETEQEVRQRFMLAFNTPFFPEILIASHVLAEGVDLHLSCRYVIHHDLSWNPSTLEQRTGRVDRIGAKAEEAREPIHVYLPYIAATQDEKMYRVVRDRERWFQILMDESYKLEEHATDAMAERVPLPEAAARALTFDLSVR